MTSSIQKINLWQSFEPYQLSDFLTGKNIFVFFKNFIMSGNIQKSLSLNQIVDAFTNLKQMLEYFERHIQNSKNQEVKKEHFRTLAQVIEAENALRNFAKVFYNDN